MVEKHGRHDETVGKETDQQILEFIRKNPLAREHEIGVAVKLSRAAVHKRLTRLKKMQHVRSGMTVNLQALGYRHRFRVDIKIDPRILGQEFEKAKDKKGELAEAYTQWPGVNPQEVLAFHILALGEKDPGLIIEDVHVVLGDPADLCAIVRMTDGDRIYPFVTEKLRKLHSISNTSTCIEPWSCSQEMQKRMLQDRPKRTRKTKGEGT